MAAEHSEVLRVVDFYAGIGGMHSALKRLDIPHKFVEVFEVNNFCNDVYEANYGVKPSARNIVSLKASALDKLAGDLWMLSPPCQPYTRQGKKRDAEDPRAASFLHIIDLIPEMQQPPTYLLVENVVGFEVSDTHGRLTDMLSSKGYQIQEFHLTPIDFSIPNQRMRYFLLASLKKDLDAELDGILSRRLPYSELFTEDEGSCFPLSDILEGEWEGMEEYKVTDATLKKSGMMMDLRTPDARRTCCFTKNYQRYVEGTGSVLHFPSEDAGPITCGEDMLPHHIRYFSPLEIARLHCFPPEFAFPATTTRKQRYRMLGNSLNVLVVSQLLSYLLKHHEGA